MSEPIWFHPVPIDFRNQIDGLIKLVANHLSLNPGSGQLFLFRDRTGSKIKNVMVGQEWLLVILQASRERKINFSKIKRDCSVINKGSIKLVTIRS